MLLIRLEGDKYSCLEVVAVTTMGAPDTGLVLKSSEWHLIIPGLLDKLSSYTNRDTVITFVFVLFRRFTHATLF